MPTLFPTLSRRTKSRLLAALLAVGLPVMVVGQQAAAPTGPAKEFSEAVSKELPKMREFFDAQNFDGALTLINTLLPPTGPESYDRAWLSQTKAQILLQKGQYAEAIPPLELMITLSDKHGFFEKGQVTEYVFYLAQLYFQEASNTANGTVAQRKPLAAKTATYIQRWLRDNPGTNIDNHVAAASILYNLAVFDADNPDKELLNVALAEADRGLYMTPQPKDALYLLKLAVLTQAGNLKDATELLELLLVKDPTNKQYWPQLAASYLGLAGETKVPNEQFELNLRAILTIERAQKQGLMNAPRDNFNLVGLYINMQKFDYAIDLLEKGLKDGGIENLQQNWEFLASSYQQVNKDQKAIETLESAAKLFPEAGALDYQIANIYYSMDKVADAFRHAQIALRKGNLPRVQQVRVFAGFLAYELKEFEAGEVILEAAVQEDPNAKDAVRLLRAIKDIIAEREEALKPKS